MNRTLELVLFTAGCLVVGGCQIAPKPAPANATHVQTLDLAAIQRSEAHFQLPEGSAQISSYSRAYAVVRQNTNPEAIWLFGDVGEGVRLPVNRAYGVGVLLMSKQPGASVVMLKDLPRVLHGGCGVVNVIFDLDTGQTIDSWCNGDDPPPRQTPQ